MNRTLVTFCARLVIFGSCSKTNQFKELPDASTGKTLSLKTALTSTAPKDYFGVIVNGAIDIYTPANLRGNTTLTTPTDPAWANTYGVKYLRLAVLNSSWSVSGANKTAFLNTYAAAISTNLQVLLNVNWETHSSPTDFPDSTSYRTFLMNVLDSIKQRGTAASNLTGYKPALIVVENEETTDSYFNITTTTQADNFIKELTAGTNVCKSYTGFDGSSIEVTNGGINLRTVTFIAWQWEYNDSVPNVQSKTRGQTYLHYAVPRSYYYSFYNYSVPADVTTSSTKLSTMQNKMSIGKYLLQHYNNLPNLTYVNIHWYEPCNVMGWTNGSDSKNKTAYSANQTDPVISQDAAMIDSGAASFTTVFQQTLTDIQHYVPLKHFITNETGQLTLSACLTKDMINKYKPFLGGTDFKYIVWYDGDGLADYSAKALRDANADNSETERPDGKEFASFMSGSALNCGSIPNNPRP